MIELRSNRRQEAAMKSVWSVALVVLLLACSLSVSAQSGFDWPCWRGPDHNGVSRETEWNPKALNNPKALWTADVGMGYADVAIKENRLYTTGLKNGSTMLSCLTADEGRLLWETVVKGSNPSQATPATDGKSVFFLASDGVLASVDAATGSLRWKRDLVSEYGAVKPYYRFAGSPVIEGDLLLAELEQDFS
jgi:hypothetical protein